MAKTISVKDEDYERAMKIKENTRLRLGEIFSEALNLLEARESGEEITNEKALGRKLTDDQTEAIIKEIKAVKKVVYRMIKELCRITDTDVNDPDSGITMRAKYDDQLQHPEKYRRRYTSTFVKGK